MSGYCVSFYAGKPATKSNVVWRWWEMMPSVTTEKYVSWARYSFNVSSEEGEFLLANQDWCTPRWTILFKALAGTCESIDRLQVTGPQVHEFMEYDFQIGKKA